MSVVTVETQRPVMKLLRAMTGKVPGRRQQRVGRGHREDGWRVYLMHVMTGQKGALLDPGEGSWEIMLNATETMSVTVRRRDLAAIEQRWYTPGWGGLLWTWSRDGVETPILAGPITGWPTITQSTITFDATGLRGAYEDYVIGTRFSIHNVSLGHIMWLLAAEPRRKPGGAPPLVDGSPDPGGRGHQRNYESWNLANTSLDKLMRELSEVRGGPDVMFRPEWSDDTQRFVRWSVVHGTSLSQRITSPAVHDIDTTAHRSPVSALQVATDSSKLVARVWATGSGEGAGTRIARAEDLSLVKAGFLFKEAVISDPGATTGEVEDTTPAAQELEKLAEMAGGELDARVDAIDQITVAVRADDPRHGIDRIRVGDAANVTVEGWFAVPDGTHETRIIKAAGGLDLDVTIDFQTDSWV